MEKIKILCIPSGINKESQYGLIEPHIKLSELYPDKFDVDIKNDVNVDDKSYFEQYDIVIYHRCIGVDHVKCYELLNHLKTTSTKTIQYLDEYWQLPKEHEFYQRFNKNKFCDKIIKNIRTVDVIITPSHDLFQKVKDYNKQTFCIYPTIKLNKLNNKEKSNDKVKFGLVLDKFDKGNLSVLKNINAYFSKYKDEYQFVLCGFETKGVTNQMNRYTGEILERIMKPQDSIWAEYERIITDNYKICSKEYKEFLLKFLPNNKYDGNIDNEPYKRVWELPIKKQYEYFNEFDILLNPKTENNHNLYSFDWNVWEALQYDKGLITPFKTNVNDVYEFNPKKIKDIKQWASCVKGSIDNINNKVDRGVVEVTNESSLDFNITYSYLYPNK